MRLVSTNGATPQVDLPTALRRGLAPDGGLYVPVNLDPLPPTVVSAFAGQSLAEIATGVLGHLLDGTIPQAELERVAADALNFPIPLVPLSPGVEILELFHGPTLAFKDIAARFMARLLPLLAPRVAREPGEHDGPLTVLTATSGDTGGAVAQAFAGIEGMRVGVLYPRDRVTPLQERQFATLGGNVLALAVDGSFDDCQKLVKAAFADTDLRTRWRLTSANSINIGRLLPQMVYYFHAVAQRQAAGTHAMPVFCTPSGNFGNLTAGLMALRLGLPCAGFIAATNINDVVPAYLEDGVYRPRPSATTLSSAMDVGDPSNFPRMRYLYGDNREALRQHVRGHRVDEDTTRATIREVYAQHGRILDPHTAVGIAAARADRKRHALPPDAVVLATAHAAKFLESVEPLIGTHVPIPAALEAVADLPIRSQPLANRLGALRRAMAAWSETTS